MNARGFGPVTMVVSAVAFVSLLALAWLSDTVTLQGERTVYTVQCDQGVWNGLHCTGQIVAADRFRFRALRTHKEVLFWTVGSSKASGKFTDCTIDSGRNWSCACDTEAARAAITCEMLHGSPVHPANAAAPAFHAVQKWRWLLLRAGLGIGQDADG